MLFLAKNIELHGGEYQSLKYIIFCYFPVISCSNLIKVKLIYSCCISHEVLNNSSQKHIKYLPFSSLKLVLFALLCILSLIEQSKFQSAIVF